MPAPTTTTTMQSFNYQAKLNQISKGVETTLQAKDVAMAKIQNQLTIWNKKLTRNSSNTGNAPSNKSGQGNPREPHTPIGTAHENA